MVGIGNIAKIAGLGVAVGLGYVLIKNAGGIGSAIGSGVGGGLASGFKGLSDGFSGAFDIFGGSPNESVPIVEQTKEDDIVQAGGIVDNKEEFLKTGGNIAQGFGDFINQGNISKEFAQKYSFQPPAQSGQLDVSNAFSYISSDAYINRLEQNATNPNNTPYGGYGSAKNQQTALAEAIQESANKYPEYFA